MQENQNVSVHIETLSLLACHQRHLQSPLYSAIENELCKRYSTYMDFWRETFEKQRPEPFVPFRYERLPLLLATIIAKRGKTPIFVTDPIFSSVATYGWLLQSLKSKKSKASGRLVAQYIDYNGGVLPKKVIYCSSIGLLTKDEESQLSRMDDGPSIQMRIGDVVTLKINPSNDVRYKAFTTLMKAKLSRNVPGALVRVQGGSESECLQRFTLSCLKATPEEVILKVPPEAVMYFIASEADTLLLINVGETQLTSPVCLPGGEAVPAKLCRVEGETVKSYVDISPGLFQALHDQYPWLWCRDWRGLAAVWRKSTLKRKP